MDTLLIRNSATLGQWDYALGPMVALQGGAVSYELLVRLGKLSEAEAVFTKVRC